MYASLCSSSSYIHAYIINIVIVISILVITYVTLDTILWNCAWELLQQYTDEYQYTNHDWIILEHEIWRSRPPRDWLRE